MRYKSKLKGSFGRIYPISMVVCYISCAIEVVIRWFLVKGGLSIKLLPALSISLMGGFFVVMGIVQLFRYRLWINLFLGIFLGVGCVLSIYAMGSPHDYFKLIYMVNMLVIVLLVIVFWPVLAGQERFEANARRIFKLSAERIEETSDGFTNRPYSAGKVNVSLEELQGFTRFINGKYIARLFNRKEVCYMTFSLNRSVIKQTDPAETSYVSITTMGEVTVQISQADYRLYRDRYNFDQLCASTAEVFIRFLNYYREGKEERITTELKTAR